MNQTTHLTFTPIDPEKIPARTAARENKYLPFIERFVQSPAEAAEVQLNGAKPNAVVTSCRNAAKGKRIVVIQRQGRVFLLKTKERAK